MWPAIGRSVRVMIMAEWFSFSIQQRGTRDLVVLRVQGQLEVEAGPILSETVAAALRRGTRRFVINLADVVAIDAAGLGQLASVRKLITELRGEIRLVVIGRAVREPLARTRLLSAFRVFSSEADAIASFPATVAFPVVGAECESRRNA